MDACCLFHLIVSSCCIDSGHLDVFWFMKAKPGRFTLLGDSQVIFPCIDSTIGPHLGHLLLQPCLQYSERLQTLWPQLIIVLTNVLCLQNLIVQYINHVLPKPSDGKTPKKNCKSPNFLSQQEQHYSISSLSHVLGVLRWHSSYYVIIKFLETVFFVHICVVGKIGIIKSLLHISSLTWALFTAYYTKISSFHHSSGEGSDNWGA